MRTIEQVKRCQGVSTSPRFICPQILRRCEGGDENRQQLTFKMDVLGTHTQPIDWRRQARIDCQFGDGSLKPTETPSLS
jgi:hypothetical protein